MAKLTNKKGRRMRNSTLNVNIQNNPQKSVDFLKFLEYTNIDDTQNASVPMVYSKTCLCEAGVIYD